MVPPLVKNKGSALLEALPVALALTLFVCGVLAVFYFSFARVWLQYQGEQALLCRAQRGSGCDRELRKQIEDILPLGDVNRLELTEGDGEWTLLIDWTWNQFHLHFEKELSLHDLARNKVSPFLRL